MKGLLATAILLALTLGLRAEGTNSLAAEANIPADSLEAFKIIAQRNIFDPNRSDPKARPSRDEEPKPTRIDYLTLVGSMSYDKGRFAFFDGSSSEYRKSVKTGDSIAGYKVAEVTQSQVTLQSDTNKFELPVGGQLKRLDEGEWKINSVTENFESRDRGRDERRESKDRSRSTTTSSSGSGSGSSSSGSGDEPSEALKRLLERRKQE